MLEVQLPARQPGVCQERNVRVCTADKATIQTPPHAVGMHKRGSGTAGKQVEERVAHFSVVGNSTPSSNEMLLSLSPRNLQPPRHDMSVTQETIHI
jgi:hypothetical protein